MKSEYSKWFWSECDELNKDTSFAHSLAEKAWNYRQTEVDELNQELHLVLNNWNDLTNAIHARTNGTAVAEARQLYEKVDELQCEVKRINLWYSNVKLQLENKEIDSAIDAKKIDELQRRNQMLNDNIKEQGQKLVYQNEVIETQAKKLLCLRDEKAELQKRVDSTLKVVQSMRNEVKHGHLSDDESQTLSGYANDLEQALRGEK